MNFKELPRSVHYRMEVRHAYEDHNKIIDPIEMAKKDAWNEALKFAADNAKTVSGVNYGCHSECNKIDKRSILQYLVE